MQPSAPVRHRQGRQAITRLVVATVATLAVLTPFLVVEGTSSPAVARAATTTLAQRPPMGWANWEAYSPANINEQTVRSMVDKMVSLKMRDLGYKYVIVGAGWQADTRARNGEMQADPVKFPSGMKALGDYIHSKGFKFGIQQPPGNRNCRGWPTPGTWTAPGTTYQQKAQFDANTFAKWGVDYLRVDGCSFQSVRPAGMTEREWAKTVYGAWHQALVATGRDIVFWGNGGQYESPGLWAPLGVNVWRIKKDLRPCWGAVLAGIDANAPLSRLAGPGHWNDPDFLVLGTTRKDWPTTKCTSGLTRIEGRAQYSMWAIMAAPLFMSTNLRADSAYTIATLTNRAVIAIDQDPAGNQGRRIRASGGREVWVKPLLNGDRAVALFNRTVGRVSISATATGIGMPLRSRYYVYDLWNHCVFSTTGGISRAVPSHGVSLLRVSVQLRTGWRRC